MNVATATVIVRAEQAEAIEAGGATRTVTLVPPASVTPPSAVTPAVFSRE